MYVSSLPVYVVSNVTQYPPKLPLLFWNGIGATKEVVRGLDARLKRGLVLTVAELEVQGESTIRVRFVLCQLIRRQPAIAWIWTKSIANLLDDRIGAHRSRDCGIPRSTGDRLSTVGRSQGQAFPSNVEDCKDLISSRKRTMPLYLQ